MITKSNFKNDKTNRFVALPVLVTQLHILLFAFFPQFVPFRTRKFHYRAHVHAWYFETVPILLQPIKIGWLDPLRSIWILKLKNGFEIITKNSICNNLNLLIPTGIPLLNKIWNSNSDCKLCPSSTLQLLFPIKQTQKPRRWSRNKRNQLPREK